ncbi:ubiquitin-like domain-containing protein [Streptomyces sp. NBC_00133]|uniref:ubiquitin-like domain-containing protein n=1 Tax=Streptomyces sp. NBC_00133 TaxID=2903624 RepID=UPI003869140D
MSNSQGSHRAAGAAEPYEAPAGSYGTTPSYEWYEWYEWYEPYESVAGLGGRAAANRVAAPYEASTWAYEWHEAPTLAHHERHEAPTSAYEGPEAPTLAYGPYPSAYTPTVPALPRQSFVPDEHARSANASAPVPTRVPAPVPVPTPAPAAGRAEARRAARRRRSGGKPDALRRLIPQALVVAFLAGGTSAFVASDKAVRLTVDGVPRTMHTFADDVHELLQDEGLAVSAHDIVAPGPGSVLASGDEVVVRYGRPVTLTLDGQPRRVWTTGRTVDEALRQLGVRAEGAYLSASRSQAISRRGLALDVRTERNVTFMADGREHTIRTNAATLREALDEAGIELGDEDTTSVPPGSFPRDGQTVTVMRITRTRQVREEPIGYKTEKTRDSSLFVGTQVVVRQGRAGARQVTYALRTVNGVRQKPKKIAERVLREPVTERVVVGTKPLPTSVEGADGLNWSALAHCESGGRPDAVDPSGNYGGLYQFDTGTWHSLGGSGRPQDAPAAEQTYRAKKLYVQRGASPWPHCGRRLYR